jgi:hypothetical protein
MPKKNRTQSSTADAAVAVKSQSEMAAPADIDNNPNPPLAELLSQPQQEIYHGQSNSFVMQWHALVSTTNWEKGAIISAWQNAIRQYGLPATSFTDHRWSQLVGGATPQHVGRLRRTYARFGHVYREYSGLYWSHFYAALDWDDAEMWLEGAVQNRWSVSEMRMTRWEALGKIPNERPRVNEIVATELDEETQSLSSSPRVSAVESEYISGPIYEGPDFGGDDEGNSSATKQANRSTENSDLRPRARLFDSFVDLPDDVQEAANQFKLAIIRHKSAEWRQISLQNLLELLEALKSLAQAAND